MTIVSVWAAVFALSLFTVNRFQLWYRVCALSSSKSAYNLCPDLKALFVASSMADPVLTPDDPVAAELANDGEDVEMSGGVAEGADDALPGDVEDEPPKRVSFVEYVAALPSTPVRILPKAKGTNPRGRVLSLASYLMSYERLTRLCVAT